VVKREACAERARAEDHMAELPVVPPARHGSCARIRAARPEIRQLQDLQARLRPTIWWARPSQGEEDLQGRPLRSMNEHQVPRCFISDLGGASRTQGRAGRS